MVDDDVLRDARIYVDPSFCFQRHLSASIFASALIEAHEKIATRDALIKSQAECIERLRGVIKIARHYASPHSELRTVLSELQPGDMGEPTNE